MTTVTALNALLQRIQWTALVVGIAGSAVCVGAALLFPQQFFRSYLVAFLFWLGMALGSWAISLLHFVTGGQWGLAIRRLVESSAATLPVMAVLFLPIALNLTHIYEWANPKYGPLSDSHQLWYARPFFFGRALGYFVLWSAASGLINWISARQSSVPTAERARKLQIFGGVGLALYGLTTTLASIDWSMSLDIEWYSTIYGAMFIVGQALTALAFIIAMAVILARRAPLSPMTFFLSRETLNDLGNLLLAFVMLWAYMAFSQLIIIWSGNLPEETIWYVRRTAGGWLWVAIFMATFHFFVPFFSLLFQRAKRNPRTLVVIALGLVAMRVVDLFWLVSPAPRPEGEFSPVLAVALILVSLVAIGGLWMAAFVRQLQFRAFLPVADSGLEGASS